MDSAWGGSHEKTLFDYILKPEIQYLFVSITFHACVETEYHRLAQIMYYFATANFNRFPVGLSVNKLSRRG